MIRPLFCVADDCEIAYSKADDGINSSLAIAMRSIRHSSGKRGHSKISSSRKGQILTSSLMCDIVAPLLVYFCPLLLPIRHVHRTFIV
jgi:hypothetical protein